MATEKRLIDANALESKMCGLCDEFGTDHLFIDAIVYEIGTAPTVDAVEVVRCRDCKHYMEHPRTKRMCCYVHLLTPHHMRNDDFCSYGERRTDA